MQEKVLRVLRTFMNRETTDPLSNGSTFSTYKAKITKVFPKFG